MTKYMVSDRYYTISWPDIDGDVNIKKAILKRFSVCQNV